MTLKKQLCSLLLVFLEMTDAQNVQNLSLKEGLDKKQFYCTKGNETCALSKGRVKKNQREIPLRRGVSDGRFSPKKKNLRSMVLKHWILHNNHFKTHLFFQFLSGPKGGSNLQKNI